MKFAILVKSKKSKFQILRENKVPLTEDERKKVFKEGATWSYARSVDPNTGREVQKVSAIWKAKQSDGKIVYVTNTHTELIRVDLL